MGHVIQVGHLSKPPLNLFEIHEIGEIDTSVSKLQNYDIYSTINNFYS